MAATTSPQPLAVGEIPRNSNATTNDPIHNPKQTYAAQLQQAVAASSKIELCPVSFIHGEPTIEFTLDDVNDFTREEGLHQAVVMKFSYGRPDIKEIRKLFSSQFDIQGHCNVGQLEFRHLLVRFDLYNDYVKFISRSTGYLHAKGEEFFFRTFPWNIGFDPKQETTMAAVWISLPGLAPNFFAKRSLMSIASAVGKALAVDKATQDKTRPSTARVKVLMDLTGKHPNKINLRVVDKATEKYVMYCQDIVYDNMPKYCTQCKHQGHDQTSCRVLQGKSGMQSLKKGVNKLPVSDSELPGTNARNSQQLNGDAREFLNAKRVAQTEVQHEVEDQHKITQQQLHNAGINKATGLDSFVANATGKSVVQRDDTKMIPQSVIPASTIFARVNEEIANGPKSVERQFTAGNSSKVPDSATKSQSLGTKINAKKPVHGGAKGDGKIDDVQGEDKSNKGEVWNIVTYRKKPTNKTPSSGQSSPRVQRNSASIVSSSSKYDALALDNVGQLDLTIPNESLMSKQLVPSDDIRQEDPFSEDGLPNNSTNVPTLHFSSLQVEKIIKDAQDAMLVHTNMGKTPLVALNTSVFEIPSQSEGSCSVKGGEQIQLLLPTGSNEQQLKLDDDDEEDCEDDEEEESTDSEECEDEDDDLQSEDDDLQSVVSPSIQTSCPMSLNAIKKRGSSNLQAKHRKSISKVTKPMCGMRSRISSNTAILTRNNRIR